MASKPNKDNSKTTRSSGSNIERKREREEENRQRAIRNEQLRRAGKPTPWEAKREARRIARKAKQDAWQARRELEIERNRTADARKQRAKDAMANELLREANKGKARKVAAARGE